MKHHPIVTLVGRPNVGKSTLFNCLTKTRAAIVLDTPGVTRDRLFGQGKLADKNYTVVDTGGITQQQNELEIQMSSQLLLALEAADLILLMVDARAGLTSFDEEIASLLRIQNKPVVLVANKVDGVNQASAELDFHKLGFLPVLSVAAAHNRGIHQLEEALEQHLPWHLYVAQDEHAPLGQEARVKVALVGRPNVGKSTLTNRLLKEERVVVMDEPGTTRDSVYIPMSHLAQPYLLIDTAGMRRRSRVHEVIEKFSTIKAKQAMGQADAVILILDAQLGLVDQDLKLLGDIIDAGKALVVALNKWDGLDAEQKDSIKKELKWKLQFAPFAKIKFISALHGTGVGELLPLVREAYNAAHQSFSASMLTSLLEKAVTAHPPPMVHGRRIKLRYAHSGGQNPPKIIIHGNQTSALSRDYKKYINNFYRKALGLTGTPIQIIYRTGTNPYQGKKNTLTSRQVVKKQRLMRFVKKKK